MAPPTSSKPAPSHIGCAPARPAPGANAPAQQSGPPLDHAGPGGDREHTAHHHVGSASRRYRRAVQRPPEIFTRPDPTASANLSIATAEPLMLPTRRRPKAAAEAPKAPNTTSPDPAAPAKIQMMLANNSSTNADMVINSSGGAVRTDTHTRLPHDSSTTRPSSPTVSLWSRRGQNARRREVGADHLKERT